MDEKITSNNKILLTIEEASKLCNISKTKLREVVKKNTFPKIMNGNRTLIIASELNQWLLSNKGGRL